MLASLRLDSSRRRKLCFFSSTFKLLWVDGYQAFSEKLGFGNFVGSLVEPFGAEGNRFMTKTVLSNTTPRGMEALYIVARRCSTMSRCWRSARPYCSLSHFFGKANLIHTELLVHFFFTLAPAKAHNADPCMGASSIGLSVKSPTLLFIRNSLHVDLPFIGNSFDDRLILIHFHPLAMSLDRYHPRVFYSFSI